ncbi:hypothetical protein CDO73_22630 [Saccharibacillus sp. O23]|uniref:hypothetical protein n=1 Tax=Saccharibacillus sp. O23 TaxID=2009338 RepID=UPI000B4E4161|nr:hypothetical protein [Saccharibacillus sp. O23]OWR27416.1 hypothetical protein CDO73_22630 [Saccharibacillus sp. O23]
MNETDRLLGRVEDWTEEMLLRGTAQFAPEDARLLERLADDARRLGMELLEQLLRNVASAGERERLTGAESEAEDGEELPGLFFRLCAYAQLARENAEASFEEESEAALEGEEANG